MGAWCLGSLDLPLFSGINRRPSYSVERTALSVYVLYFYIVFTHTYELLQLSRTNKAEHALTWARGEIFRIM